MIDRAGLLKGALRGVAAPAGALLLVVGAYGGPEFKPTEVAIATVVLLVVCWGIFIRALGLPIAALPG